MEKKQTKHIKVIILSVLLAVFSLSICFNTIISNGIKYWLYKADIKVDADDMLVHFVQVGQGDAIAITFPNQQTMLIDAGPKRGQNDLITYINNNVISSKNTLTIDYLVLSHPDSDHSGGMSAIFENFDIDKFIRPNIASISEDESSFLMQSDATEYDETIKKSINEKDLETIIVTTNQEFNIGDVNIKIFAPLKNYKSTNEMSMVIKITYLNKSFLFCGDIQNEAESDIVKAYSSELDVDVLKVAHHGSGSSTSQQFVDSVTPKYAVICVGNNSYGHPKLEVVERLQDAGAKVVTTNEQSIRIVCGHEKFTMLEEDQYHSSNFIDWWIVVLCVDIILLVTISIEIVKIIKSKKIKPQ